jgi:glycosyltransferase involved in cell wall biosynthesis
VESEVSAQPLVSVVTITRNNLDGLVRTRASVAGQTYPAVQHIVVDGASDDGTAEWLASHSEPLDWVSEPDRGRYDAMNKGTRRAGGVLLWYLNSGDTFSTPSVLDLVVADWLERRWRWAYGCQRVLAPDGEIDSIVAPVPFRLGPFALGARWVPHQAACFEASLVDELGGYDEDFGLAADQLFMLCAALVARPSTIAEFLSDFDRTGAGSNRRGPFPHLLDMRRARRLTGTTLQGGPLVDGAATLAFALAASAMRFVRGRLSS